METKPDKFSRGLPQEVRRLLSADFLDSERCLQWFFDRYYPDGPKCPTCGAPVSERALAGFLSLRRFTCRACGSQPRPTKGTILQDSPFTPEQLFLLAVLVDFGIESREVARIVGITQETVRTWRDKFAALAEIGH